MKTERERIAFVVGALFGVLGCLILALAARMAGAS